MCTYLNWDINIDRTVDKNLHRFTNVSSINKHPSLVPRPTTAFRQLYYGKASDGNLGGAWEQGYKYPILTLAVSVLLENRKLEL